MIYIGIKIIFCIASILTAEFLTTEAKFLNFIDNINKVERFDSVFLFKPSKDHFSSDLNDIFIRNLTTSLRIPIILSTEVSSFYLKREFNENLLTIVQFDSSDLFLQRLLEHLQHLRFSKTIFVLKNNSSRNNLKKLQNIFNFCWLNRMVNVVVVFQDFVTSSTYYSYSNFGQFTITEFFWINRNSDVFPNRMQNLQNSSLPVIFGATEPAQVVSKTANGNTIIGGHILHLFHTFAKKHNAMLDTSNVKVSFSFYDFDQRVFSGKVEISGTSWLFLEDSMDWHSYPHSYTDYGVMLPIEPNVPIYKIFAFVFHWETFLILVVVVILLSTVLTAVAKLSGSHRGFFILDYFIDCFRGILGQSFSEESNYSFTSKLIYSLIFLLGIMIVTSYDAFLQSFMTEPPKEKTIRSFEDLNSFDLKIVALQSDIDETLFKLSPTIMKKYSNSFLGESNLKTFLKHRDSLDDNYAFALPKYKWNIYENQQNFYGQQLFRWSKELCFLKDRLVTLTINENSIYKQILNTHILEVQSAGLMGFWQRKGFLELIRLGRIKKLDFEFELNRRRPLKVEDFKWIWIVMGLAYVIAGLCFIAE
ncbi:uncharacterized protein LOC129914993, partial [Episyrphus balteatus]|uniref:uncharacterized protein LOC129914993 n=1 Tax=Episyrphus balteatus TaxID=286459 RepID=UPI002484ED71